MKKLLVVLVAALAVCSFGQDLKDTHGKTNAQILAMGFDKWYSYYTKADGGESTASMSMASYTYSTALAWRNDRLIGKLPKAGQAKMKALRAQLVTFNEKMLQAGESLTGGGTIWHIIGASAGVSLEETLYGLLGGKEKPAPAMVVSKVTKALDALDKEVANAKDSDFYEPFKKSETVKLVADARAVLKKIVASAVLFDRKGSDRILSFCHDRIGDARQADSER